jgi:phosphogluconate dehydratase
MDCKLPHSAVRKRPNPIDAVTRLLENGLTGYISFMKPQIIAVTRRIQQRSAPRALRYLGRIDKMVTRPQGQRSHGLCQRGACLRRTAGERQAAYRGRKAPHLAIVSAYNDMLSAHQPYEATREDRDYARELGCHGADGRRCARHVRRHHARPAGMELSLFSRDTIAMSTALR